MKSYLLILTLVLMMNSFCEASPAQDTSLPKITFGFAALGSRYQTLAAEFTLGLPFSSTLDKNGYLENSILIGSEIGFSGVKNLVALRKL